VKFNNIITIICVMFFVSCLDTEVNKKKKLGLEGQALTYSSMPIINIQCGQSEASDCGNNNPMDVITVAPAGENNVYVLWNVDTTCTQYGTDEYAVGVSVAQTTSVSGLFVQLMNGTFIYSNGVTTIPFGIYALWIGLDSNNDGSIDVGEPVNCTNMNIDSELGALERTSGWRSAVASDVNVFMNAGR
jgi:hypothetical protein